MLIEKIYKHRKLIFLSSPIIIFACYLTFLFAPFYFDDFYNIVHNPDLNSLSDALRCRLGGFRPFAYLWFYFDKKFFGLNPFYFRLENVILHLLNFILVFNVLKYLTREFGKEKAFVLSFFASLFWALNPINSQSVAYIVQRMNEAATMFILIGFLFYLKAIEERKVLFVFPGIVALVVAMGFKETGVLLIPLCLLHYTIFKDFKKGILGFLFFIMLGFSAVFFLPQFDRVLPIAYLLGAPVNDKAFTIVEKFLTSFKVILDYLIVFLFPLYRNIHLYYGFFLEKSVFSIGFLIPFIIVFSLFLTGIWFFKKNRFVSFLILSPLLLLFPENSFLPLDIAYQHRMYLPSVFLSLLVVFSIFHLIEKEELLYGVFGFLFVFLILNLVVRGVVFSFPEKFYANELLHAPNNEKIYINAAKNLIEKGNLEEAYYYLEKGLRKFPDNPLLAMNMGLFWAKTGELDKAIYWYKKAEKKGNPFIKEVFWSLAVLYLEKKDFKKVKEYLFLLEKNGFNLEKINWLKKKLK